MNLESVQRAFEENFSGRGELGASVSVWRRGHEVLNLASGFCDREKSKPWSASTLVLFWSATKGLSAACVLNSLQQHKLGLDTRVAQIWPEFAQNGKEAITIGQLLAHQAGLAALDKAVSVLDYAAVIDALASQPPLWPPGQGHGYHPRTIGFLMDEIVRRLNDGMTLGNYWRLEYGDPLDREQWSRMPAEQLDRVSPVHAPRVMETHEENAFQKAFRDPKSLTRRAFSSPAGLNGTSAMNTREARMSSFAAFGGIGTASSLAKFYSVLANSKALEWMKTPLASGFDKVLQEETAFFAGFMMDPLDANGRKIRATFGPSTTAFGHPGAGGSVAFADPENEIALAYVMNQMGTGALPNDKAMALIKALYD